MMMQESSVVSKPGSRRAHVAVAESVDVAVVGAGLGGLVAAAQLARRGLRVAVFEQHYVAGGCATQFSRGPKRARYHFDVGLHYIGDCGPDGAIPRILREVGVELAYEPMDPDGFDTLVFPGLRFRIPSDVERYRARLKETFPHESRAIDRYVRLLRATMKASRILDRRDGRMSLGAVFAMALDGMRVAGIQGKTIGQVLDACGARDPRLRAVLLGQSGDYGLPPARRPPSCTSASRATTSAARTIRAAAVRSSQIPSPRQSSARGGRCTSVTGSRRSSSAPTARRAACGSRPTRARRRRRSGRRSCSPTPISR